MCTVQTHDTVWPEIWICISPITIHKNATKTGVYRNDRDYSLSHGWNSKSDRENWAFLSTMAIVSNVDGFFIKIYPVKDFQMTSGVKK